VPFGSQLTVKLGGRSGHRKLFFDLLERLTPFAWAFVLRLGTIPRPGASVAYLIKVWFLKSISTEKKVEMQLLPKILLLNTQN
jgi:hypothetical protein